MKRDRKTNVADFTMGLRRGQWMHKQASRKLRRTLREWLRSWEAARKAVEHDSERNRTAAHELQGLRAAIRVVERWSKRNDPTDLAARQGAPLYGRKRWA